MRDSKLKNVFDIGASLSDADRVRLPTFTSEELQTLASLEEDHPNIFEKLNQIASIAAQALSIDSLTGIYNRGYFYKELAHTIEDVKAQNGQAAIIYVDLNDFKEGINDKHGHQAGDLALIQLAHNLKAMAGENGIAARLGGDEFAVILKGASADEIALRFTETFRDFTISHGGHDIDVKSSLGIATINPEFLKIYHNPDEIVHAIVDIADQDMYVDKQARAHKIRSKPRRSESQGFSPDEPSL